MLLDCLLRMTSLSSGEVSYSGRNLWSMNQDELRGFRRDVQLIFQDPVGSLHPRMTIEQILSEPLAINAIGTPHERKERAAELLQLVGWMPVWPGVIPTNSAVGSANGSESRARWR